MADILGHDLDTAITALSRSVEAVERRLDNIDAEIVERVKRRKTYITNTAAELLPSTSWRVLSFLQSEIPYFVTPEVQQAFIQNKKFFGFIPLKGHARVLGQLQIRLAGFLDQFKYGQLNEIDDKLSRLSAEQIALREKSTRILQLLRLMQQAREQYWSKGDDSFDVLFYVVNDIPISMRTLLFDVLLTSHERDDLAQADSFGGSVATDDFIGSTAPQTINDSYNSGCQAGGVIAGSVIGAATPNTFLEASEVATDDSLGRYS